MYGFMDCGDDCSSGAAGFGGGIYKAIEKPGRSAPSVNRSRANRSESTSFAL